METLQACWNRAWFAGADLLKKGQLARRTTFVPLNVTRSRPIPPERAAAAKKATNGRAAPALDLVRYDPDVKAAVQYAYGTAFICEDAEVAKTVCYNRNISTRGISLQVWTLASHRVSMLVNEHQVH